MGELQFAKTFLTTVDSKSTKYQPDYVFDPKTLPTRIPYTLPKLSSPPHPAPPKSGPAPPPPPGSESAPQSLTITLKSSRNPALSLTLTNLASSTPIADLKYQIQHTLGGPSVVSLEKIKILANKKPIPPSKTTIAEVLDGTTPTPQVEFGVMVMGGAPDPSPSTAITTTLFAGSQAGGPGSEDAANEAEVTKAFEATNGAEPMSGVEKTTSPPAQQPTGKAILSTPEFWTDLQGFLEQRLRDQDEAARIRGLVEMAWKATP